MSWKAYCLILYTALKRSYSSIKSGSQRFIGVYYFIFSVIFYTFKSHIVSFKKSFHCSPSIQSYSRYSVKSSPCKIPRRQLLNQQQHVKQPPRTFALPDKMPPPTRSPPPKNLPPKPICPYEDFQSLKSDWVKSVECRFCISYHLLALIANCFGMKFVTEDSLSQGRSIFGGLLYHRTIFLGGLLIQVAISPPKNFPLKPN